MSFVVLFHPGGPLAPHDLWAAWTFEPSLLVPLGLLTLAYLLGVRRAWQRAGPGRGFSARRASALLAGVLALLVALVSPLDSLSEALFSAHMLQHLILILVAAPLLAAAEIPQALLWALPRRRARGLAQWVNRAAGLRRLWQLVSSPVSAWLLFTLALWVWHAAVLYEAALRSLAVHAIEHSIFLASAMLFWWVLFRRAGPGETHYGMAIPYLFSTSVQSGILGALMTFTTQPWYSTYAATTTAWGLTPLQDQQLAGLVMWIPGGLVFTLLTIAYFAAWFRALERRAQEHRPVDHTRQDAGGEPRGLHD